MPANLRIEMALRTHNLITNETTQTTNPFLAAHEFLLLPHESPENLATIATNWTTTYPGDNHLIASLRLDLIAAHWHRTRASSTFTLLEFDLYSTGLPRHHWDQFTSRRYDEIDRLQSRAKRDFTRALKLLHSMFTSTQPKGSSKPAEIPPPPPPAPKTNQNTVYQHLTIEVIDGKVSTKYNLPPAHWLRIHPEIAHLVRCYRRHYFFPDRIVPPEYAHVMTHLGVTYKPVRSVEISYTADEFLRLCQLEIDTQSELALDGDRLGYSHFDQEITPGPVDS